MPVKPVRWGLLVPLLVAGLTGARASRAAGTADGNGGTKKACVQASTEGQSLRDAAKLMKARDAFVTCAKDECPAIVRKACAEWLTDVDRRIPTVVLRATAASGEDLAGARFSIDGAEQSAAAGSAISVDPGEHVVHMDGPNGESVDEHVVVMEGQKARIVTLHVPAPAPAATEPTAPETPSPASGGPSPTAATWIFGGIGVVGLGAFAGLAVSARSSFDNLQKTCAPSCASSDVDPVKRQALIADVSLGVGVVALGIAAYTFFSHREAPAAATTSRLEVHPRADGAVVQLGGAF
jgi:hypothetical protein